MSDGASAFALCGDDLGLHQVLCSHHFTLDVGASTVGMNAQMKPRYMKLYNDLIYHDQSEEDFK